MIQLYNSDCIDILKTIPDKSIDMILTDPPYDVKITGGGGTVNAVKHLDRSLRALGENDIKDGYNIEFIGNEFLRVLKSVNLYVWCNKIQIPRYFDFYVNEHSCKFDIICWHKGNALPTYSNKYLSDTEYCLYFHKGDGKCFPQNYEDAKTYSFEPINQKDKNLYEHPTIKPLSLIMKLVRNSSFDTDVILDPFMGSGTTGVACKKLGRNFIGCEISEKWFKVADQRINGAHKEVRLF